MLPLHFSSVGYVYHLIKELPRQPMKTTHENMLIIHVQLEILAKRIWQAIV